MADEKTSEKPKLTDKQKLFVSYYVGQSRFNATDAARRAGYSDPEQSGWANKKNVVISDEISRRCAAVAMGADEVLVRLAEHARGSIEPFLVDSGDTVFIDLATESAKKNLHLVKKCKTKRRVLGGTAGKKRYGGDEGLGGDALWPDRPEADVETEVEIELHDPQAALVQLGRHHKLFTDKTVLSGPNDGPIQTEDVGAYRGMDRGSLNERIAAALKAPDGG